MIGPITDLLARPPQHSIYIPSEDDTPGLLVVWSTPLQRVVNPAQLRRALSQVAAIMATSPEYRGRIPGHHSANLRDLLIEFAGDDLTRLLREKDVWIDLVQEVDLASASWTVQDRLASYNLTRGEYQASYP